MRLRALWRACEPVTQSRIKAIHQAQETPVSRMSTAACFFHPAPSVETESVGEGTRVWAFAHILPGARIGAGCNICDHTFIENDVVVGDRVTVKCGVPLWDGVRSEDDLFIGPNATFSNDRFPRSKKRPAKFLATVVKEG